MYIRLNAGLIYGYENKSDAEADVKRKEIIRLKKPVVIKAEEFRVDVSKPYYHYTIHLYKTELTGDNYILPGGNCKKLLAPGDVVKLKKGGEKIRVYSSGMQSFSFYTDNGCTKRRPYFYKNGDLSFETIDKDDEEVKEELTTDWMDDNLKYNYECFKNLIRIYYPEAEEDCILKEFNLWYNAKKDLMETFRKHPNWNEKEKCIICDLQISRKTDISSITTAANELFEKMSRCNVFNIESARCYSRIQDWFLSRSNR